MVFMPWMSPGNEGYVNTKVNNTKKYNFRASAIPPTHTNQLCLSQGNHSNHQPAFEREAGVKSDHVHYFVHQILYKLHIFSDNSGYFLPIQQKYVFLLSQDEARTIYMKWESEFSS